MNFSTQPTLSPNPNPKAPLAAILTFTTDAPSRAHIELSDGVRVRRVACGDAYRTDHRLPVVGFCPGAAHMVTVVAEDEVGNRLQADNLSWTAPPLPDDFPPFEVGACIPERREPGMMMFCVRYSPASEWRPDFGLLLGVDQWGRVCWSYSIDQTIGDVRRLSNGNILCVIDGEIREIDLLGDTVAAWYAAGRWRDKTPPADALPVAAEMFHHAAIELPNGNFLACSMEIRDISDFPATEDDPDGGTETARVVGDVIVEFARDGSVVNEYRLLDLLDPQRVSYGSRAGYWIRRGYPDTCDWSHVNGLSHDPADDSFVASVRHQDCMIKIGRASGELVWILGDHGKWRDPWKQKLLTPEDGTEWQYHQHDCSVTAAGTVLCFDNGNNRAVPFDPKMPDPESYSRAVEFAVSPDGKTVRQAWVYGNGGDRIYSTYQSGVYRLPETGNTFIDYGGVCTLDGAPSARIDEGHCVARVREVTGGDRPETVFDMVINDTSDDPVTLSSFRAEHFPDVARRVDG